QVEKLSLPSGAVIAFGDPKGCPAGWDAVNDYAGRVVLGTGQGTGLTQHPFREQGVAETHSHSGTTGLNNKIKTSVGSGGNDAADPFHAHEFQTNAVSSLPPYISLYYCRR